MKRDLRGSGVQCNGEIDSEEGNMAAEGEAAG